MKQLTPRKRGQPAKGADAATIIIYSRITAEERKYLDALAETLGVTNSSLIRNAIRAYLKFPEE